MLSSQQITIRISHFSSMKTEYSFLKDISSKTKVKLVLDLKDMRSYNEYCELLADVNVVEIKSNIAVEYDPSNALDFEKYLSFLLLFKNLKKFSFFVKDSKSILKK